MNQVMNSILSRLNGVKPCGNGWKALCPAHDDQKQSLHVSEGKDGRVLIHCHAGCSVNDICQALGIDLGDLFPPKPKVYAGGKSPVVATYDYRDTNGKLLFQVCRTADKRFFQRRPDGKGGWLNGLGGIQASLIPATGSPASVKAR
jgi:putative DNA primase/helicase